MFGSEFAPYEALLSQHIVFAWFFLLIPLNIWIFWNNSDAASCLLYDVKPNLEMLHKRSGFLIFHFKDTAWFWYFEVITDSNGLAIEMTHSGRQDFRDLVFFTKMQQLHWKMVALQRPHTLIMFLVVISYALIWLWIPLPIYFLYQTLFKVKFYSEVLK